ncbi:50S ribosomal protein L22 [candidate division WOR-1 bacterium RIFOXYA12_FULL_52_29]|uniref:Large ribosomal subunit protein uL22 n=1 Tax=candidate division WOR-1 bacterium RIFOXYC12_FULL_54_18 TaxID=1802584 RepID=A0A1F4T5G9_UNCSA|nr:MAG: 50S ribosomal protein L22 [candidate division WOR-1 bacterium RIFOXYA2_FULL_51_19]OGC17585.1 MAG: 50S ribosomal protein L22 [candidate division WOR-1 bacterium RIFOXYA12_FULL_52_29]OGC26442.1 MAG: 50S ribosomal protein L22 [candidate division WOR-1 bacterium RIFOXYB2_FULL_45_9]OGC28002.1 MAG: 50S ribosomal protein L22 [candidate division WOR-1 bacterium RIFOXYC12_FULL_54_18]OGC29712.1 MAG: 50S ribosomal protein L22 [candidate division WOR-1 bacterium RIFOXYB12_FULL_52_16]
MVNVLAKSKWVRSSPRKIMRVMDEVRGKSVAEAVSLLKFMPQKAARVLEKTLLSAVANARNNYKMDENKLVLGEVFVTKGFVMKRFQPRARGRAFPIKKRTSHVTVSVREGK